MELVMLDPAGYFFEGLSVTFPLLVPPINRNSNDRYSENKG